jgi:hypothetical protein
MTPGQAGADARARWAEATDRAEAGYCKATGIPARYGYPWIRYEPAGRHDYLMRLRARLSGGYDPDARSGSAARGSAAESTRASTGRGSSPVFLIE